MQYFTIIAVDNCKVVLIYGYVLDVNNKMLNKIELSSTTLTLHAQLRENC